MHTFWRRWLASQRCAADVEEKGCQDGCLRDAIREALQPTLFSDGGGKGVAAIISQLHHQPDHAQIRFHITDEIIQ